jgi:hypothetical protein
MNFAPGLAAANAYFDQNEHLQDRDHLAKQRAYQQAVMDAKQSGLGDEAAAESAVNRLKAEQARSGLEILPQETKNRVDQLSLEGGDIAFKKTMQPTVHENAKKSETVRGAGLDLAVEQIPVNQKKQTANNAQELDKAHAQHLATLGQRIFSGDIEGALNYMNDTAAGKRKFVELKPVKVDGKQAVQAIDSEGNHVLFPRQSLEHAINMQKTGKYSTHMDRDSGALYVTNEFTGDVQEKVKGDPRRIQAAATGGKPSEMQMQYQFLTQHPDGPKLSAEKATEMVTKGSRKTPEERYHMYKQELVKQTIGAPDIDKISELAQKLSGYDPKASPGIGGASNTPNPVKIDPKYQGLFTKP